MKHTRSIMSIALATIMLVSLCAVCASTSVSAATSSGKASVQATPDLTGSPIAAGTGPAACVLNGTTNMYVFVKGYDSALWYRAWSTETSTWVGGWTSLGGNVTSSPAATSPSSGQIYVFARGPNGGDIAERASVNGATTWSAWTSLGGQIPAGTGPAATSSTNYVLVFVEGMSHSLYEKSYFDGTWSAWSNLGGMITSSPAAVSRGPYLIDVHARGRDGADWYRAYVSGWRPWATLGGQLASGTGPALSAWGTDREDVFVEGTHGALYQKTWTAASGWSNWIPLGGYLSSSPAATPFVRAGLLGISVWVRGANGLLYYKIYWNKLWFGWYGPYQGPP